MSEREHYWGGRTEGEGEGESKADAPLSREPNQLCHPGAPIQSFVFSGGVHPEEGEASYLQSLAALYGDETQVQPRERALGTNRVKQGKDKKSRWPGKHLKNALTKCQALVRNFVKGYLIFFPKETRLKFVIINLIL